MTDFQTILLNKHNSYAEIILNRPDVHNALNEVMIAELTEAINHCDQDQEARYIKLSGAGKSFCAGADINWMRQMASYSVDQNIDDARKLANLFNTIYNASKPTIAYVKGSIFGGGVGLAAACDIVIADESAIFSLSEVKLGVIPAVISPYILRAMGERHATRYALTGERFMVMQAQQTGLVHLIADNNSEGLVEGNLLLGSPVAQQHTKSLFREVASRPISKETHEITAKAIAQARASVDGIEGLQAFLEKRKPAWVKTDDK